ncbi:MAG: OFA family MFS transporter [Opitutales bacterium]|nr:OFA family MFS transporter [Opitutales bacterium]
MFAKLKKEHIVAKPGFNRWKVPPASLAIHLCIGSVYAWSIYNPALISVHGVADSASTDWSLREVVWIFSVSIVFLGLAAAFGGKWLEKVGPRMVGVTAATCWGGGYLIGALGIWTHQLWLLYLGYGAIGGIGLGLGYVSPVSTLIRWFPDRRGMATGLAIMGFGGGALIGAPLKEYLLRAFYESPEYLGPVAEQTLRTVDGVQEVQVHGDWQEAIVMGTRGAAEMRIPGEAGVYLAQTGNSGAFETFFLLGLAYFLIMTMAAFAFRVPAIDWKPEGWVPPTGEKASKKMMTHADVHMDTALKTPQFYLLWIVLCFNVTAGIGVLSVARDMMTEIFGDALPHIVTGSFAATYVGAISVFNMIGRFFWASTSDYLGRKTTYNIFFVLGILLYLIIPFLAWQAGVNPAVIWLVLFYAVTMLIFTLYGGGFATIPAYLADVFGTRHVGAIHGRLLTAWSIAGVLGPVAITALRERSLKRAIEQVATEVDPGKFQATFGESMEHLPTLVERGTVTLSRLMEIAPESVRDPSNTLYNTTMFLMAGLLVVALVCNLCMRPVDSRHHWNEKVK